MIKRLLKNSFSTTVDYLSTKNLKKFGIADYPDALNYSRPFSKFIVIIRAFKDLQWDHSGNRIYAF